MSFFILQISCLKKKVPCEGRRGLGAVPEQRPWGQGGLAWHFCLGVLCINAGR